MTGAAGEQSSFCASRKKGLPTSSNKDDYDGRGETCQLDWDFGFVPADERRNAWKAR